VSPALGLAVLFVLIGAQLTRLALPRRLGYLWVLLLSAAGLVAGELFALVTKGGGPQVGVLHPVAELVGILGFELLGAMLAPARRRSP
jgi:hypothetical protein